PPFWRSKQFWLKATPTAIIVLMLSYLAYLYLATLSERQRLEDLEQQFADRSALKSQASAITTQLELYRQQETQLNAELLTLNQTNTALNELNARQKLVRKLLQALEKSVDDEVLINALTEPDSRLSPGFQLQAWAVTSEAASAFNKRLAGHLSDFNYDTIDDDIHNGRARGMNGYLIDLWIVPASVDELEG
ncbi:MAG: hypothetical protein OIF38_08715, partial [Cellvibrionaceae bacterium]|nr:hypothetical protein [Cellvibrionaceae bacterium]